MENYKPTQEEINKAEEMMTEEQKKMSEYRSKSAEVHKDYEGEDVMLNFARNENTEETLADMKRLAEIDIKAEHKESLSNDDLRFLYGKIENINSVEFFPITEKIWEIVQDRILKSSQEIRQKQEELDAPIKGKIQELIDATVKDSSNINAGWSDRHDASEKIWEIIKKDVLHRKETTYLGPNWATDMPAVCECQPDEIAHSQEEFEKAIKDGKTIKAYNGPLFPGIFATNLENIYTNFPDDKIIKRDIGIGGQSKEDLKRELEENDSQKKINFSDHAKAIIDDPKFEMTENKENITLVKLTIEQLGGEKGLGIEGVYKRAEKLGLELCPDETGARLAMHYKDFFKEAQHPRDYLNVAMKPKIDPKFENSPVNFGIVNYEIGGRVSLDHAWASSMGHKLIFKLKKI